MISILTDSRKWSASLQKMEQLPGTAQSFSANAPENGAVGPISEGLRLQKMETLLSYQWGMGFNPFDRAMMGMVESKNRRAPLIACVQAGTGTGISPGFLLS
ncbi:hypothetical protein QLQ85_19765 [Halomonas sp. M4R5S39]|uniref:hypothetical protein n=1 Tax=Halomonas kalidii TaxID=3043293 RepID=UPI0024A97693|nr:hypothetical protein [Halomonas kalidii]MDI5987027.1 hypothetical protein [Halomonas kalidii]